MKKFALIILFFFLTLLLSCDWYGEDCPDVPPYYSITSLDADNLKYNGTRDRPWEIIPTNSSVAWDKFFMSINFGKSYYSHTQETSGSNLLALSCIESGYKGSQVGIDTLYLITQQDYNHTHLKNDTINDIALANYMAYFGKNFDEFFPISQYISENDSTINHSYFELKLIEKPADDNVEHQFKMVYILDDGNTFEVISEKVKLLK